jgi:broad specificity phosphatase PhoE
MISMAEIFVIRHGQTTWSADGRHTSTTDLPLTDVGVEQAKALAPVLAAHRFALVLTSPRERARHTAELAGLHGAIIDDDLAEWNYGEYEGITTEEIRERDPNWLLWRDGCPGGESPAQVAARLDHVLDRARAALADGDVALVAHGHSLRVATARWLGLDVAAGALFALETATISRLGFEHGTEVLTAWNQSVELTI